MKIPKKTIWKVIIPVFCMGLLGLCAYLGGYVFYRNKLINVICQYEQIHDWDKESDIAKIEYARDFVYANIEFVDDASLRPDLVREIFYGYKPCYVKLFELAETGNDHPAGFCGGMSLYLSSLYNLLG